MNLTVESIYKFRSRLLHCSRSSRSLHIIFLTIEDCNSHSPLSNSLYPRFNGLFGSSTNRRYVLKLQTEKRFLSSYLLDWFLNLPAHATKELSYDLWVDGEMWLSFPVWHYLWTAGELQLQVLGTDSMQIFPSAYYRVSFAASFSLCLRIRQDSLGSLDSLENCLSNLYALNRLY